MIPVVDLKSQHKRIELQIKDSIARVISHGKYILGPEVFELEQKLCDFTGSSNCISVANGTDALQIALMALQIGPGDEVIIPAFSYISVAETVSIVGATPIFADIDPSTFLISSNVLESLITSQTKAIIPVSLFGQPADFLSINLIAEKYGINVIEDGAQSFGSYLGDRRSCSLSRIGCTSFFPSKPLGCYGDGGAIFTNDNELAVTLRQIARHGQDRRYHHVRLGLNSRLDTIQAAILLVKLTILEDEIYERNMVAKRYTEQFLMSEGVRPPQIESNRRSAWAQYTVRLESRDSVRELLQASGIQTAIHYPMSICTQPAFYTSATVPNSDKAAKEVLSLPISGTMALFDQDRIIQTIKKAIKESH